MTSITSTTTYPDEVLETVINFLPHTTFTKVAKSHSKLANLSLPALIVKANGKECSLLPIFRILSTGEQLLINGAKELNLNLSTPNTTSLLHSNNYSVYEECEKQADMFRKAPHRLFNDTGKAGNLLLVYAAARGWASATALLLRDPRIELNVIGQKALFAASINHHHNVVKQLSDFGKFNVSLNLINYITNELIKEKQLELAEFFLKIYPNSHPQIKQRYLKLKVPQLSRCDWSEFEDMLVWRATCNASGLFEPPDAPLLDTFMSINVVKFAKQLLKYGLKAKNFRELVNGYKDFFS